MNNPNAPRPIATLTRADGFVFAISGPPVSDIPGSPVSDIPGRIYICQRDERDLLRDQDGNVVGTDAVAWIPIPFTSAELADARRAGESLSSPAAADPDLIAFDYLTRQIVFELAEAIGPKRALERLVREFSFRTTSFKLPEYLSMIQIVLNTLPDDEALMLIRASLKSNRPPIGGLSRPDTPPAAKTP